MVSNSLEDYLIIAKVLLIIRVVKKNHKVNILQGNNVQFHILHFLFKQLKFVMYEERGRNIISQSKDLTLRPCETQISIFFKSTFQHLFGKRRTSSAP